VAFDTVAIGEQRAKLFGAEEAERRFENGTDLVTGLEDIDGILFHQVLQPFGQRGFAAAHGTEQVQNLPLFLEPLRRVLEVADDALDRILHSEESVEGAVDFDRAVEEYPAEPRFLRRVDERGFSDCGDHPFRGTGVKHAVVACGQQPVP
jgi:hypothetical protein